MTLKKIELGGMGGLFLKRGFDILGQCLLGYLLLGARLRENIKCRHRDRLARLAPGGETEIRGRNVKPVAASFFVG